MKNIVALIGKPNVGKSTLFNKLVGKKVSIIHDSPGVTRDRIYSKVEWAGKEFYLIDTGGIEIENKSFQEQIRIQTQIAIEEANLIIFLVDGRVEIDSDDHFVIDLLRKSSKKVLIAANKLEGNKFFDTSIYSLGFEHIFPISAIHGEGVGDLLDETIRSLDFTKEKENEAFRLAIIGKPNAGKSTLLNKLANENRSIVSPIAGTTRDSVSSFIKIDKIDFEIIDTAGIIRKSKIAQSVDFYALLRAFNSLDDAQLSLILIDATQELSHFDARLAGYAFEKQKPIILVVNKWDLIEKETNTQHIFMKKMKQNYKFLDWAPICFISAQTGSRISKLRETILEVKNNLDKKVSTNALNQFILDIQMLQPPPSVRGKKLNIKFAQQIQANIPIFLFFVNDKNLIHFSYQRYIENQFRNYFGFSGCPIKIIYKNKKEK
ncbi:ribosome biogenesis GTPase Der [Mesomycoplasma hyorhinis]|uniref:GTPase Der n=3 Tax=Mesomycoplasma hyorhinis TaxID=2100 RepID=A0ABD6IDT0_MESHY|nr:ribosome biogenesis GTPase Der [Mesomycoplasma hyorhinis]AEC45914.1 GTP-binding protein Der [Mesomycoplasma hyorhinis MCLD]AEX13876.1 GTP-binding protein engA [Mesomycoplasma hyorhinis GDL-1]AFX74009.1 GTP-binding protein EngA [Mesomycoplasma hyorhinis SK76]AHA40831.1 GTP-binding EngA proterin [Mesomycoplasma hyorhinis DBS 1050]AOD25078.1 GTP-binding protein engA [Mesomycoplasma hyorhinis]